MRNSDNPTSPPPDYGVGVQDGFFTLGGRIACRQCQARAKSTGEQCRKPAVTGKRVCRTHGGASTGPKTEEGRKRCAAARTVHGEETRKARTERSLVSARLAMLEALGYALGMMSGPRTRGRKPLGGTETTRGTPL